MNTTEFDTFIALKYGPIGANMATITAFVESLPDSVVREVTARSKVANFDTRKTWLRIMLKQTVNREGMIREIRESLYRYHFPVDNQNGLAHNAL